MEGLLVSVIKRPYVFIFLITYLILAWKRWGAVKTLVWLISGYAIAWASEFSSINTGFPYGEYHYIYENMPGELMVAGVPFFDSLSYPFLVFAGFTTAEYITPLKTKFRMPLVIFISALLTTILDIIIDPVAKLGSKWFLGEIYYYAKGGWYFNVPTSNFKGWFLVALIIALFNVVIWSFIPNKKEMRYPHAIYPAFYVGIAMFNISISFMIGADWLGMASTIILLAVIGAIACGKRARRALP